MGRVRLFRHRLNSEARTTVTASGATGRVFVKWPSWLVEPRPMRSWTACLLSSPQDARPTVLRRSEKGLPLCGSLAACVSCRAVRVCEIIARPSLATRGAVLTHIPPRVGDRNALFLEHFEVRKPLSPIASPLALQPLPPLPQADPPPFDKRGTGDRRRSG